MDKAQVLARLKEQANPGNVAGMARYGINPQNTLGVSMPVLRALARQIGRNHGLALELWKTAIHEARILAGLIDDPARVTRAQMDRWVSQFDSWDVCDQVCNNLFSRTPYAYAQAVRWAQSKPEFVKRAGFVMMACLAVHDKEAPDSKLAVFFPLIREGAADERNFVKKAVNWALRQLGKRSSGLNRAAVELAGRIREDGGKSARWVASDALKELTSPAVQKRI